MRYEYKSIMVYHSSFKESSIHKYAKEGWRIIQSQMSFDKPNTAWEAPKAKWYILMERKIEE